MGGSLERNLLNQLICNSTKLNGRRKTLCRLVEHSNSLYAWKFMGHGQFIRNDVVHQRAKLMEHMGAFYAGSGVLE